MSLEGNQWLYYRLPNGVGYPYFITELFGLARFAGGLQVGRDKQSSELIMFFHLRHIFAKVHFDYFGAPLGI